MIDRQSIANDLNAIANGMTRSESLTGILAELDIVYENIDEINSKEIPNVEEKKEQSEDPSKDPEGCPVEG